MKKPPVNRNQEPTIPSCASNFVIALAFSAATVWCFVHQGPGNWGTWLTLVLAALTWFVAVGTVVQYRRFQAEKEKEREKNQEK